MKCLHKLRSTTNLQQKCPLCRSDLPPGPEDSFNQGLKLFYKAQKEWSSIDERSR